MKKGVANRFVRLQDTKSGSRLFLLCWLMYAVSYLGRYNYSGVMNDMIDSGLLGITTAGTVATGYFAMYGVGQLVHGGLGRQVSPLHMMLFGTVTAGCANLLMPLCGNWQLVAFCWAVNGFAQATIWPATIRIIADILPDVQKEKACINICSSVTAGTLCAYAFTVVCLRWLSWRAAFSFAGVLMLSAAVLWRLAAYPIVKPLEYVGREIVTHGNTAELIRSMTVSGAAILLLPVLAHGMLRDGITTWIPVYMTDRFDIATDRAVTITMLLPIVNLSGAYIADWLNRRTKNEVTTAGILFCCAVAAILGLLSFPLLGIVATALLFSVITAAMCGINTMLVTLLSIKLGQDGNSTIYSGILNSTAYLGGALSSFAIAVVLSIGSWDKVNLLWGITGVLSAIICFACASRWAQHSAAAESKTMQ